ncbi:alanine racemase [Salibacterium aidingense]|uniref:alanine racemase n=1 Tax=Salibacterium aidingense TaxID=384933 RepID=UPI000414098E|nr:alanine racemase [Salibacterium aidingense]
MQIATPYIKINLDQMEKNIDNMVSQLNKFGISHRPHIKPHKSIDFADLQIEKGAEGISCATLYEVEIMARAGIKDILLAYPIIGKAKLDYLKDILKDSSFQFTTIVESEKGAEDLSKLGEALQVPICVLLDIDGGGHREGVQPGQDVQRFASYLQTLPGLNLKGLFTYNGDIYGKEKEDMKVSARTEAQLLLKEKERLENNGIFIGTLSAGSTISSHLSEELDGITESRAGNYIFYDMNAVHSGVVTTDECALTIISQVVSIPYWGHATMDAGSKTMTTDDPLRGKQYGKVINRPGINIVKLNEEHGFLKYNPEETSLQIGDTLEIIPNHACVVPNLHHEIFGIRNGNLERRYQINARGRHYAG